MSLPNQLGCKDEILCVQILDFPGISHFLYFTFVTISFKQSSMRSSEALALQVLHRVPVSSGPATVPLSLGWHLPAHTPGLAAQRFSQLLSRMKPLFPDSCLFLAYSFPLLEHIINILK